MENLKPPREINVGWHMINVTEGEPCPVEPMHMRRAISVKPRILEGRGKLGRVVMRSATERDAGEIIKVFNTVAKEGLTVITKFPYGIDWERRYLREFAKKKKGYFFVLQKGEEMIGHGVVAASNLNYTRHTGMVEFILKRNYRYKGLEKQILDTCMAWIRPFRVTKIKTDFVRRNRYALKVFRRYGFKWEGTLKKEAIVNNKFMDIVIMRHELKRRRG
ncbi:MAG: GNAT family N-acetyltransferase [Candidatus Omnitrophota bacterium]